MLMGGPYERTPNLDYSYFKSVWMPDTITLLQSIVSESRTAGHERVEALCERLHERAHSAEMGSMERLADRMEWAFKSGRMEFGRALAEECIEFCPQLGLHSH